MMAATTGLEGFVSRMRNCFATDERSDAELVRLYAEYRSDEAFAELVKRYAPMIWGVCRRRLGNYQLAEDAFQAVFLVFVRKVASIRPPAAVGGWLHTVAVHTSIRTRIMAERRRHSPLSEATEKTADNSNEPVDSDLLRVLDDEIAQLPDKLRTVVALCELGGVSRHDAAARLGIAEGTLSSRLAAARKQLATRFRTRGIALSAASLSVLIAPLKSEAVPSVLTNANGTITAIADGVIRTMFISQFKLLSAVTLVFLSLVIGGIPFLTPASANDPRPARRNAPVPKVVREGLICLSVTNNQNKAKLIMIKPDGTVAKEIEIHDENAAFSPVLNGDGSRVAVFVPVYDAKQKSKIKRGVFGKVVVYDIARPEKPLLEITEIYGAIVKWGNDRNTLYLSEIDPKAEGQPNEIGKPYPWISSKVNVNSGLKTALDIPSGHYILGIYPDGRSLFTGFDVMKKENPLAAVPYRIPFDSLKPEKLDCPVDLIPRCLSPDVGMILCSAKKKNAYFANEYEVYIVEMKTQKKTLVKMEHDTDLVQDMHWSPDGKKVVMIRSIQQPDVPSSEVPLPGPGVPKPVPAQQPNGISMRSYKTDIVICNPDGANRKVIYTPKFGDHVNSLDWR